MASESPKEDPKRPSWDPNGANEDAPGQQHRIGCTDEVSPGQKALDSGNIGPKK